MKDRAVALGACLVLAACGGKTAREVDAQAVSPDGRIRVSAILTYRQNPQREVVDPLGFRIEMNSNGLLSRRVVFRSEPDGCATLRWLGPRHLSIGYTARPSLMDSHWKPLMNDADRVTIDYHPISRAACAAANRILLN